MAEATAASGERGTISVLCQLCGAANPEDRESCVRCGHRLMVVSGPPEESARSAEEALLEVEDDFEEHVLERVSGLEDNVRQLTKTLKSAAERLERLEHNLMVAHAGVQALGRLLEAQGIVSRAEVVEGWERSAGQELLAHDLSRRFQERAPRILSLAAHAGVATPDFRRRVQALELALLSSQTELVRELLTDLARMAPTNDELWSLIGETSFRTGDLEAARVAFSRVHELRGPHYETLIYLGTVSSDLGRWDEAEAYLVKAREMATDAFLPHFALGALSVMRGDHRAAIPRLEASVERDALPQAFYLLGQSELALGRSGKAVAALRRAVELAPDYEDALYQLGVAYLRRGWQKLALETFQHVLRLDPQRLQYQETVRLLSRKQPLAVSPQVERMAQRAEAALERGRPELALDMLSAAVAAAPEKAELQATAALLASALGRTRVAVSLAHHILRRGSEGSPYVAAAVVALLESLRQVRRLRAAQHLARSLYQSDCDQLARGMAAYELALVESELGDDLETARELAREALEIAPRELRHYPLGALGVIALKRGRFREATQYLEQATETAPVPVLLRHLAVARLGAGDSEGAERALAAARKEPSVGLDRELLGHVRRLGTLVEPPARRGRSTRNGQRGGPRHSTE